MNDRLSESLSTVEPANVPQATDDQPHLRVVGITDPQGCPVVASVHHVAGVVLADETRLTASDAIAMVDAGRVLYMLPPSGAPAHEASEALGGARLLLQVRECEHCGNRVLFA
jgi:hypothetical protein